MLDWLFWGLKLGQWPVAKHSGRFLQVNSELYTDMEAKKKAKEAAVAAGEAVEDDDDVVEETPASRFVARLLKWLLQGLSAKNKNVRYRCVQVIAEVISYLGFIE